MKLGIVVVYLVAEDDDKLLDLHLAQIQKHTSIPYIIYAGTNRLLPKFIARLQERPEVKICSLDSADLRNAAENSFYLEQLVKIAIDDVATHVVTLHPDSFPIRDGWAQKLSSEVDGKAFATVDRGPYTACLFFARDFYLNHQPHFLLSDAEHSSAAYEEFSRRHKHVVHSGVGYLYRAFADGLRWHSLTESNLKDAFGIVYDGLVFHLHGNARLDLVPPGLLNTRTSARMLLNMRALVRNVIPGRARRVLWDNFGDSLTLVDKPAMQLAKQKLLENPDAYFARMRVGKK